MSPFFPMGFVLSSDFGCSSEAPPAHHTVDGLSGCSSRAGRDTNRADILGPLGGEWDRPGRPPSTVHPEHGVDHRLGDLLDSGHRMIHCLRPVRPSRSSR